MSDAFDIHAAVLTPRQTADWPATAEITSLTFTANGLSLEFTKKDSWPNVIPKGWEGPIEFTVWFGTQTADGQWHLAASLNCWRGETEPLGGPVTDPTHYGKNLWYLDNTLFHVPAGEKLAVMVSSGAMRGVEAPGPAERSNIVVIPFPHNDSTFTFGSVVTVPGPPVTAPVPPFSASPTDETPNFLATVLSKLDAIAKRQDAIELKLDALALKPAPAAPTYVGSVWGTKIVLKPSNG